MAVSFEQKALKISADLVTELSGRSDRNCITVRFYQPQYLDLLGLPLLNELPFGPPSPLNTKFYSSTPPILSMIVSFARLIDARSL